MTLDEALAQLHQLPAIPAVLQEVVASFGAADLDIDELAKKIGRDQALTARVLRVANSSFYGFPRQIASLHDAVVVMGLAGVRSLVLSTGLVQAFSQKPGGALDRVEYWQRSLRVAIYAKAVARCLKQQPEVAFTAGMLHDLGLLVLDTCLPEQYAQVVAQAEADGNDLIAAEQAAWGFHHGVLGAEVARRWNFPPVIEHAIRDCQSQSISQLEPISGAVWMAARLERGEPPESFLALLSPDACAQLGPDASRLIDLLPDADQLQAGVAALLG